MDVQVRKPTIEKLMRVQGLQVISQRKGVKHFAHQVTTTDRLNREFLRSQPDKL